MDRPEEEFDVELSDAMEDIALIGQEGGDTIKSMTEQSTPGSSGQSQLQAELSALRQEVGRFREVMETEGISGLLSSSDQSQSGKGKARKCDHSQRDLPVRGTDRVDSSDNEEDHHSHSSRSHSAKRARKVVPTGLPRFGSAEGSLQDPEEFVMQFQVCL